MLLAVHDIKQSGTKLGTSSNHGLESAGLNALEELLFKMLGMGREDSNVCLVCKGNLEDHFIESVTENWRHFRFQLNIQERK